VSATNLDLARSIVADWVRGDYSRADWADPEIEFDVIASSIAPTKASLGVSGMAEGFPAIS
jgi:hypothetical protein